LVNVTEVSEEDTSRQPPDDDVMYQLAPTFSW